MASAARPAAPPTRSPQPLEQGILVTVTLCLLAAGAVMVYSASAAPALLQGRGNGTGLLVKYLMYTAVGLVAMRVLARRGLELAPRFTLPLLLTSLVLVAAVRLPHVGVTVNGARRWLGAGPLQFQPSELLKLALVLYAALLISRRPERVRSHRELLRPLGYVIVASLALVASQPDLGTAIVIAVSMSCLLVVAGMPLRYLGACAVAGVVFVLLYSAVNPYAAARLTSFVNPWAHAASSGFQAVQGQIAIGSGGLLGRGPGQSVQKIFYLPEAHTDFILAVIGEEVGVLGVGLLLSLYGLIAHAGFRAAREARSVYAKLVATGVTSLILSQACLNVFAVLGMAPLTGVPLPFVSYGASSLVILLAGMGLLVNVAAGGVPDLRAVRTRPRRTDARPRHAAGWAGEQVTEDRDRRRRDRGARRARPGGGGRAATGRG